MWLIQKHYKIDNSKECQNFCKAPIAFRWWESDSSLFSIKLTLMVFPVPYLFHPGAMLRIRSAAWGSQFSTSLNSDVEQLVSKLNLGSLGYTKTVAAEIEGVSAAEYLTEVTVIRGSCWEPEPSGTSLWLTMCSDFGRMKAAWLWAPEKTKFWESTREYLISWSKEVELWILT